MQLLEEKYETGSNISANHADNSYCTKTVIVKVCLRDKLMVEKGVIYDGDIVVPPIMQRRKIIKSIHNDGHCRISSK